MEIIIARATLNEMAAEVTNTPEAGLYSGKELISFHKKDITVDNFVNLSVKDADGMVTVEINDKMIIKYVQLYIKLAKILMPMFLMLKNALELFRTEAKEFHDEFLESKDKGPWIIVKDKEFSKHWVQQGWIGLGEVVQLADERLIVSRWYTDKNEANSYVEKNKRFERLGVIKVVDNEPDIN